MSSLVLILLALVGLALIALGVFMVYAPAGFVVLGAAALKVAKTIAELEGGSP